MIKKLSLLEYLKILIYGIVFMIVAYVLSGDTASIVIGLLVMYLEYKFHERTNEKVSKR
jgi:hypothetical protein